MNIYQVKESKAEITEALQRLIPQLNPMSRIPNGEELQQIIENKNTFLFVGEKNGMIIATISVAFYRIPTGKKAWIEDVVVDENARGKGYGKMLMQHAIDFAKSEGISKIYLTSNPSRIAANNLYQSVGFEQYITNVYRMYL
ncbi:MAG: GNAT family N-acetyltransferase [Bacteroidales bacterium]|nr:GNAT family N-acetyltransferase [Bacteroidales bacterium]